MKTAEDVGRTRERETVFRTITVDDWGRAIRRGRATGNAVAAQIQEKILVLKLGISTSENIRKT